MDCSLLCTAPGQPQRPGVKKGEEMKNFLVLLTVLCSFLMVFGFGQLPMSPDQDKSELVADWPFPPPPEPIPEPQPWPAPEPTRVK